MGGNYTLATSMKQYEEESERYLHLETKGFRDDETNLCDVGDTRCDAARLIKAFEDELIDEDVIGRIERVLRAVGTLEDWEIENPVKWFRKNIGKNFILVYE